MLCKSCKQSVNVLDTHCPNCGSSLSILDNAPVFAPDTDTLLERTDSFLNRELQRMDQELTVAPGTADGHTTCKPDSSPAITGRTLSDPALSSSSFLRTDGPLPLETSEEEIVHITSFAITSPHVQANMQYQRRASETSLIFLPADPTVNAFATDSPFPDIDAQPPFIVLYGGFANITRLMSLAVSYDHLTNTEDSRHFLISVIHSIGKSVVSGCGTFDLGRATDLYSSSGLAEFCTDKEVIRRARSYGAAMNMAVIAHELGHIVLGHTLGRKLSFEISRNQERDADSFASSVASTCPFSDYIVAGGIFCWVAFSWIAAIDKETVSTTHPHPRERLMDYIRSNADQASAMNLDKQSIEQFLP